MTVIDPPERPKSVSRGYFHDHRGDLAQRLRSAIPVEDLRQLHQKSGFRHFLVAGRQIAMYAAIWWALIRFDQPWIWLPLAALQGIVILSFIILLHDVVHEAVFKTRRPKTLDLLGVLYGIPSAIASSQFKKWHLDHHKELGSPSDDPKRAHLSPKRNSRFVKALYMTPALFAMYAKAAGTAVKDYPKPLQRRIALERFGNIALHLSVLALLWTQLGWETAVRAHIVPFFVFFPMAFIFNRLGQHYWIDPTDPAKWGTRVDGSWPVRFLFLNSNLHLEHHYFPGVPLYSLPILNQRLRPFWTDIDHPSRSYPQLLWGWFVENREAHTNWK